MLFIDVVDLRISACRCCFAGTLILPTEGLLAVGRNEPDDSDHFKQVQARGQAHTSTAQALWVDNLLVSRHHAEIIVTSANSDSGSNKNKNNDSDMKIEVMDLGSVNGTFVGKTRCKAMVSLCSLV